MSPAVALVGPPNSGKTTLFNWLTGRRQKVVNYAGSTVEIAMGESLPFYGPSLRFIDTPGTYSLAPKSQDEEVTLQTLFSSEFNIGKVVVVLDSTQISRQVHLVRQVQEAGFRVVVAITMHDLHEREQSAVDIVRLSQLLGAPVCPIDGLLGGGVKALVNEVVHLSDVMEVRPERVAQWSHEKLKTVFTESEKIAREVVRKELRVYSETEKIDRWLLHPIFGLLLFVVIMFGLFTSIYWLAQPIMDLVSTTFAWVGSHVSVLFGENLFSAFLSDGVLAGTGAVLVFVPQIFILFLGITLLEDTGYLARAATLADRPLSFFGLNGRAFVPILSGFACAVPAVMAARSINSKKERWIATFIIPFMTCSARLPVYALLIGFLFPANAAEAGLFLALLYLGGLLIGLLSAGLLSRLVPAKSPSLFIMELPLYRRPKPAVVIRNSVRRTRSYLTKTAPVILVLSVLMWAVTTFPKYQASSPFERLEASYAAQLGRAIEPAFRPIGADWRVGVGLISAFAARETFVSSLAVLFNSTEVEDKELVRASLIEKMRSAHFEQGAGELSGRPIFSVASVAALIVFFMLALQCLSTSSVAFRETGSWVFATTQVVMMNLAAYGAAAATFSFLN
jgi:ferrous iron transport protein B